MEDFSNWVTESMTTNRAQQRHMTYQERWVEMKEAARRVGAGCKGEPAGKGELKDNVLRQRENLIWPGRLKRLLQKWQMASLWGHTINKIEQKSQWQKIRSVSKKQIMGGGWYVMPKTILIRCDRKLGAITCLTEWEKTGPMMPKQEGCSRCGPITREADN